MEEPALLQVEDGIAIITLNRPDRRNAINQALLAHLYNHIDTVASRDDIKVAILTGNGKSFCSGIDLAVIATDNLRDPRGDGRDFLDVIGACTKPIIGAINGHAITGGFEIVTTGSISEMVEFYRSELEGLGFEVSVNTFSQEGSGSGGMVNGRDESEARNVVVILSSEDGETTAVVSYNQGS